MATNEKLRSVAILSAIPQLAAQLQTVTPKLNLTLISPENANQVRDIKDEIIIADLNLIGPHIYNLPQVKWIQGTFAGIDKLIPHIDKSKGPLKCQVTRFSGNYFGRMMSEYIVMAIVSFERDLKRSLKFQEIKEWNTSGNVGTYKSIADMTIGILGIGSIGSYVAETLKLLGATIWGFSSKVPDKKAPFIDRYCSLDNLDELLGSSDCVVNVLPDTPNTRGLLNSGNLRKCKGSLFVNVGRGSVVKEEHLIEALNEGWLRGAFLDVFPVEPLPSSSLLWSHPQVTITPHVSAVSRAKDIVALFLENLKRYEQKEPLKYEVDFNRGY